MIIWRWQATKGETSLRGELSPLDTMSYRKKVELHKQGVYFYGTLGSKEVEG